MKFNSNSKHECGVCKFYKSVDHGFGEPTGYCLLKRNLAELAKSFGIKIDSWFESTGVFSTCDISLRNFLKY